MTRRPLSSPAPVYAGPPVTQSRWAACVVPARCSGCSRDVDLGARVLAVRRWEAGDVRARVESYCTSCVEGAQSSRTLSTGTG